MMLKIKLPLISLSLLFLILEGCLSFKPQADPTRFYVLDAVACPGDYRQDNKDYSIGVAIVEVPDYMDRPQIVSEINDNEVRIAEFNRWAEPMDKAVTRVITQDLAMILPSYNVNMAPWVRNEKRDQEVHVKIFEFMPRLYQGVVCLQAQYSVINVDKKEEVFSRRTSIVEPIYGNTNDYSIIASAMSGSLRTLSQEIADAVLSIHAQ